MIRRALAIADRAAAMSYWLVLAVNALFFLMFVITLLVASARAEAAMPCRGQDIMAQLAKDDPPLLARIHAEAAAIPDGRGLLWKVQKDGIEPSFLFGTMHVTDPRVVTLPAAAEAAFESSATVVIETTDVLDHASMTRAMLKRPDLMTFTDGSTLEHHLAPGDVETVRAALDKRGVALANVHGLKPWMLVSLVSLPACELARKSAGLPVLDVELAERAGARGKDVAGLETLTEQLEAMASLPMELHVRGLVETLKLGDRADDLIETMLVLYARGETGAIMPFFRAVTPAADGSEESAYAAFEEAVVTTRNRTMAERARPLLEKGGAFVAVGALHLPGRQGLVALLREAGFTVTRAD